MLKHVFQILHDYLLGKPRISSLTVSETITDVIFNCISTESPATSVTWLRDGTAIQNVGYRVLEQHLVDRRLSTYENLLIIPTTMILSGTYSCNVSNVLGVVVDQQEICKLLNISLVCPHWMT